MPNVPRKLSSISFKNAVIDYWKYRIEHSEKVIFVEMNFCKNFMTPTKRSMELQVRIFKASACFMSRLEPILHSCRETCEINSCYIAIWNLTRFSYLSLAISGETRVEFTNDVECRHTWKTLWTFPTVSCAEEDCNAVIELVLPTQKIITSHGTRGSMQA